MNAINETNDTIAAISTPLGEGGIGIVRLSGERSLAVVDRIFEPVDGIKPSSCSSHTVHYGRIKMPLKPEVIDEVLITIMRRPKTYTAEDIVEINCHGGVMPLKKVLGLCLKEGARLAEPGEFTKRAFLNGRIDLAQAEAVIDVIKSRTDVACKVAIGQLQGVLSNSVRDLRNKLIESLALIELTIDFSEEDVDFPSSDEIKVRLEDVNSCIKDIVGTYDKGMVLRNGVSVVICGRPNVGKSSLMNALLRHDRVIVTPVAGTTRDVVEEYINVGGVEIRISDTAGIIETRDRVEIEGIKRSREKLDGADVVIFMMDHSRPLSSKDREIYGTVRDKEVVVVVNKTDIKGALKISDVKKMVDTRDIIKVSALKKKGLDKIEDSIAARIFKGNTGIPEGPVVTSARHKELLDRTSDSIGRVIVSVSSGSINGEIVASDLNEAVHSLGLIIGESVSEDILDNIFSQFCIGK